MAQPNTSVVDDDDVEFLETFTLPGNTAALDGITTQGSTNFVMKEPEPGIRSVAWRIVGKPVSVNQRQLFNLQSKKVFDSPETKKWKKTILDSIPKGIRIDGPVAVTIMYVFRDRRSHDVDNFSKVLLDTLKHVVFGDDNDIQFLYQGKVDGAGANTPHDYVDVCVQQLTPSMRAIQETYNPPLPPAPEKKRSRKRNTTAE